MTRDTGFPKVDLIYSSVVNYSIQQNRIPVVRSLIIENNTGQELSNIQIKILSEPEFIAVWNYYIDFIPNF